MRYLLILLAALTSYAAAPSLYNIDTTTNQPQAVITNYVQLRVPGIWTNSAYIVTTNHPKGQSTASAFIAINSNNAAIVSSWPVGGGGSGDVTQGMLASSNFLQSVSASNYTSQAMIGSSNFITSARLAGSNYLQSVASSNYLQSVAASNYLQSVAASNYVSQSMLGSSNFLQSVASSNFLQSVAASNYTSQAMVGSSNFLQSVAASNYTSQAMIGSSNFLQSVASSNYVQSTASSVAIASIGMTNGALTATSISLRSNNVPTLTALTGAGGSPTLSFLDANPCDSHFVVRLIQGSGTQAAGTNMFLVTFGTAFPSGYQPVVIMNQVQSTNLAQAPGTGLAHVSYESVTNTGFKVCMGSTTIAAATTNQWQFLILGNK